MRVTAIVVNYHTADLCRTAVASVLAQAGVDVRVAVVDNSVDADEARALQGLAADARVVVTVNDVNAGFGAACRQAYAADDAPFVMLLNPDAQLLPGALRTLADLLERAPRAGAVSPRAWLDDERSTLLPPSRLPRPRDLVVDALVDPFPALVRWRSLRHRSCTLHRLQAREPWRARCLSGAHMLVRRAAAEASGGLFDPRFFMYYEDSDLCRRLAAHGWQLFVEPSAQAVHHYDQSRASAPGGKPALGAAAEAAYLDKYDHGGIARALARGLRAALPAPAVPTCEALGVLAQPPAFDVPGPIQGRWALEVSRHPQLRPAAVVFGSGPRAQIPASTWRVLRPATYYCRLGGAVDGPVGTPWCFERLAAAGDT